MSRQVFAVACASTIFVVQATAQEEEFPPSPPSLESIQSRDVIDVIDLKKSTAPAKSEPVRAEPAEPEFARPSEPSLAPSPSDMVYGDSDCDAMSSGYVKRSIPPIPDETTVRKLKAFWGRAASRLGLGGLKLR